MFFLLAAVSSLFLSLSPLGQGAAVSTGATSAQLAAANAALIAAAPVALPLEIAGTIALGAVNSKIIPKIGIY